MFSCESLSVMVNKVYTQMYLGQDLNVEHTLQLIIIMIIIYTLKCAFHNAQCTSHGLFKNEKYNQFKEKITHYYYRIIIIMMYTFSALFTMPKAHHMDYLTTRNTINLKRK